MGHRLLVGVSINPAPEPSIDDDPFVWIVQGVSISLGLGSASGAQVDSTIKSAKTCPFIKVLGANLILVRNHFILLPDAGSVLMVGSVRL